MGHVICNDLPYHLHPPFLFCVAQVRTIEMLMSLSTYLQVRTLPSFLSPYYKKYDEEHSKGHYYK